MKGILFLRRFVGLFLIVLGGIHIVLTLIGGCMIWQLDGLARRDFVEFLVSFLIGAAMILVGRFIDPDQGNDQ